MKWLSITVMVVTIAINVRSQCFTEDDEFNVVINTDLSSISDFGLDLFRELLPANETDNLFFSPYSLWSALALAYFGSKGNTERQLQSALRVSNKIGTLRLWKALEITHQLRSLLGYNKYTMNLANRIYVDSRLPFRNCIETVLSNEVRHIDFRRKSDAVDEINRFVSDTTAGRIKDLANPQMITVDTRMVLVNAVYFKGDWETQFEPTKTQPKDFITTNGFVKQVDMMQQRGKFKHGDYEGLGNLIELPYVGNAVSMYLLLPFSEGDAAFNNAVQNLNGSSLQRAIASLRSRTVDLQLPKFKLETTLMEELSQALKNIGIVDLFDPETANLRTYVEGINLSVDSSVHKAFLEVSEEGTEAAAATALIINTRIGPKINTFHCNRPFIFFLYDNDTKNILFMGAFRDPK